ncbi:MAG: hypothetical protein ABWY25_02145 [Paenisporosarcina sp.]
MSDSEVEDDADPSVPTELLELHVELEDSGMTPEEFKEVFGNGSSDQGSVGSETS